MPNAWVSGRRAGEQLFASYVDHSSIQRPLVYRALAEKLHALPPHEQDASHADLYNILNESGASVPKGSKADAPLMAVYRHSAQPTSTA